MIFTFYHFASAVTKTLTHLTQVFRFRIVTEGPRMVVFITGGVRSGKSRFAQSIARASKRHVTYVATARQNSDDAEWMRRIERHRADRPQQWQTVEMAGEPLATWEQLFRTSTSDELLLIDSLGTWLADQFDAHTLATNTLTCEDALSETCDRFASLLADVTADVVIVSEETGWGIVPEYPSGRIFRDVLGRLNQTVATRADRACLIVCGRTI